jgi:hypothetical protein
MVALNLMALTKEQEHKLKRLIETYHRIEESRAAVDEIAARPN